jgi:L-serine dehydratase
VKGTAPTRPSSADSWGSALDIAEKEGLDFTFEKTTLSDDAHPNTVRITLDRAHRHHSLIGASIGAGRIRITEIDGYPVEVSGSHHTIVLVAEDIKGSIARIATLLAEDGVNIATLRLTRQQRGGDAFMVIEVDEEPGEKVRDDLRALPWVRWTHRLDKVSA